MLKIKEMIRKTIHMNRTGKKGAYMAQHHKKLVSPSFIHMLCVVICTIAACLILNSSNAQTGILNRYNVILISMDDMADKTNYLGYPVVLTPNLQRLINKSTAFTNAYCQYPLCNPSRSSIMTGWRPDKTTVFGNSQDPLLTIPSGANFLQEYFHSFGYRTERYGKIYHGLFEAEFNWDYAEGRDNSSFKANDGESVIANAGTGAGPDGGSWGIDQLNDTANVDYLLVTNLIASLKKPSSQPRFFALGLSNHNPFTPTIDFWNLYGDAAVQENLPIFGSKTNATIQGNSSAIIEVPNTPADDRADIPPIALLGNNTVVKSDTDWRKTVQAYYGEVSRMDAHLGMLLDELDRENLWENTVIVFVSDHGQHLGEHGGLWLKSTLFNESLHVPLLIYAPGKSANLCNKLVEEVDIYPTLQ
jgi:iduronate 2-sulfatase